MAIKFSQFVVETSASTMSHIVGYDGADNIQITPNNFFTSFVTGTAGQVPFFGSTTSLLGDDDFSWDNSNKRLGIGTTSPLGKLQVNKYTVGSQGNQTVHGELSVFANNGDESLFLGIKDAAYPNRGWAFNPVITGVNSDLQIKEHGSSGVRMTIQSGGNVGIGTSSPGTTLDVVGTLASSGITQLGTGGSNVLLTSAGGGNVGIGTSSPSTKLYVDNGQSTFNRGNTSGTIATFRGLNSAQAVIGTATSYFNSNVGIGNTNPQNTLHLGNNAVAAAGALRIDSFVANQYWKIEPGTNTLGIKDYDGNSLMTLNGSDNSATFAGSIVMGGATLANGYMIEMIPTGGNILRSTRGSSVFGSYQSTDGPVYFGTTSSDDFVLITNDTARLTLNAAGNATFAGSATIRKSSLGGSTPMADGSLVLGAGSTDYYSFRLDSNADLYLDKTFGGTAANVFSIDRSTTNGNITFAGSTTFNDHTKHPDQVKARFGTDADATLEHNGSHFFMDNIKGTTYFRNTGANSSGIIIRNGDVGDIEIDNEVAANIKFNTSNVERMRINSTGDVGIGTTNPQSGGGAASWLSLNGTAAYSGGVVYTIGSVTKAYSYFESDYLKQQAQTGFGQKFIVDGTNTAMTILSNGDVGIGTSSPDSKLHIEDTLGANIILNSNTGAVNNGIYMTEGTSSVPMQVGAYLYYNGSTNKFNIATGVGVPTDKLTILRDSGNVGIGTTSPTAKLTVVGLAEHADNAAAISAGLTTGAFYRTGDLLKVVH